METEYVFIYETKLLYLTSDKLSYHKNDLHVTTNHHLSKIYSFLPKSDMIVLNTKSSTSVQSILDKECHAIHLLKETTC